MSKTAFTIKASCCYILALGLGLVLVPNMVLSLLRMPPTSEVWIRVLGVVVINIGVFFWVAARTEAVHSTAPASTCGRWRCSGSAPSWRWGWSARCCWCSA
jgi:hypothetical protein